MLEAATTGNMSALDAARLNVQRAGHDLSLLDGLRAAGHAFLTHGSQVADDDEEGETEQEVAVNGASPLALARRR